MHVMHEALRYGQRRATRKLLRAVPWLGTVAVIVSVVETMKRKGVIAGAMDSALDAIPFLGGVKTVCEAVRGREFIPERQPRRVAAAPPGPRRRTAGTALPAGVSVASRGRTARKALPTGVIVASRGRTARRKKKVNRRR
jgi:hypothetical protein